MKKNGAGWNRCISYIRSDKLQVTLHACVMSSVSDKTRSLPLERALR